MKPSEKLYQKAAQEENDFRAFRLYSLGAREERVENFIENIMPELMKQFEVREFYENSFRIHNGDKVMDFYPKSGKVHTHKPNKFRFAGETNAEIIKTISDYLNK